MAKNKKNKKSNTVSDNLNSNRKPPVGKVLILVASTAVVYSVYLIACRFQFKPIVHIYAAVLTVLMCAYIIMNRGLGSKSPEPDMLPQDWSEEKKTEYIEDDRLRKKRAKPILMAVLPFIFTFLFDMLFIIITNIFNIQIGV